MTFFIGDSFRFPIEQGSFEEEMALLGDDPRPHGVKKNRANLERFMGYSLDQGLMEKKMSVEELFAEKAI